jgi:restriction system protein
MAKNSLFAVLLRSPWWISVGVAAGIALVSKAALPEQYVVYGVISGWPFLGIGMIAAWKQFRAPSAARVTDTLEKISAMSWRDFSGVVEDAFRHDGYSVSRLGGPEADFAISKAGKIALISCKRWKAANSGIEPLRDLHAAIEKQDAHEGIYLTAGAVSDNARRFATDKKVQVVQGADLAKMLLAMRNNKEVSVAPTAKSH